MIIKDELVTQKKNLLFDIDGTLLYFDTLYDLIDEALIFYGIQPKEEYYKMQTDGVIKALKLGELNNSFSFKCLIDCWEETLLFLKNTGITAKEFGLKMLKLEQKYVKEIPNTKSTLEFLKTLKYNLLCSTNWLEQAQREKLRAVNIENYFSKIYTCENTYAKPDSKHFYYILQKEKFNIDETIMIGDSGADVACKKIGLDTILFDPNGKKESLYNSSTVVITDMTDLKKILKK